MTRGRTATAGTGKAASPLVAGIFDVVLFEYITADSGYCVAHLEPL
jgi:hypothetical protein